MKIPEKLKIGGKIYTVEITDKLYLGKANCSAEILFEDLIIRVSPQAKEKMETDFLHEMMHGIFNFLGYRDESEKQIDELANALYMVICENPKLLKDGEAE